MIHRNRGENRGTVCEVRVICVDVGQLNCHQVFYLQCKEDTELNFLRLFILLLNDILKAMETVWLYSYDEKKSGYHFVRWGKSSKEKISHHFDYSIMKLWKSLHFHYLQKNGITRLKRKITLTIILCILTSVWIFSILFSRHFLWELTRRIWLTINSFFCWWSFPLFL